MPPRRAREPRSRRNREYSENDARVDRDGLNRRTPGIDAPAGLRETDHPARRGHGQAGRRFRRRHAGGGRPVHQHLGAGRQRRRHVPRLSRRDSRAPRHPRRRQRLPGAVRLARHLHARRHAAGPGRHEPRRPRHQHQGPREGRHPHRQRRELQGEGPEAGPARDQSSRGRDRRRLPPDQGPPRHPEPRGGEGGRGAELEAAGPVQELLRPGADLLAVRPRHRADAAVRAGQVRQQGGCRRRQREGVARRLVLRRDDGGVRPQLSGRAGPARPRHLPEHHGQPGPGLGAGHRGPAERQGAVLRLVSDHARRARSSRS